MRTLLLRSAVTLIATVLLGNAALGGKPIDQRAKERTVFVTGSLIPRRIQVRTIGTTTVSPLRVIDRREIDQNGRYTTPGAFVNEPAVRVLGH